MCSKDNFVLKFLVPCDFNVKYFIIFYLYFIVVPNIFIHNILRNTFIIRDDLISFTDLYCTFCECDLSDISQPKRVLKFRVKDHKARV